MSSTQQRLEQPDTATATESEGSWLLAGTRRRVIAGLLALALVTAAVVLALGGGQAPPATGAAALVPADALAYVNVSLDPGRRAVGEAVTLARRFPSYPIASADLLTRLGAIIGAGRAVDWRTEIRPWLGNELAVAFLDTTTSSAGSLIVLGVSSQSRARAFVKRDGATGAGSYRGIALLRYPTGVELAFLGNYLVVGDDSSVRAAIDVRSRSTPSLQQDHAFAAAAHGEPDDRVLDAYVSAAGVRRILLPRPGLLGALGVLLDRPSLRGVTISLSPASGGVHIRFHSALDPSLSRLSGAPAKAFAPTLQAALPYGSTLLYDVTGLRRIAPQVLAAGAAAGIGGQIEPLLRRLGGALAAEGVDVRSLLSIFDGETAVAVTRDTGGSSPAGSGAAGTRGAGSGAAGAVGTGPGAPSLIILSRTRNASQTRAALAALEAPLAELFPAPASGPGQAPVFNEIQVDGVTVRQLALTPGLQLDYAVFDGLVVLATSRYGIAAVAEHQRSLAHESEFGAALAGRPDHVSSLLFLDFSQLLTVGEQTGLTRSAAASARMPDLERIRAVGMSSTGGESDTTAELYVQIP